MTKTKLIRAAGYLRKSTKGKRADGKERQEKSISQQKSEIIKLAKGKYDIVEWFSDDGVSGWKRGAKRPEFQRMIDGVKALGVEAILVDNVDRFSRAAYDEVQEDVTTLRKAGVRWIVSVAQGDYDMGSRYDIGSIIKLVIAICSSCEYSRQLSRRVTLARRNAAQEGKHTGGSVPYAMAADGHGGLKFGEASEGKVVKWIFEQYASQARSLCWIANDLNNRKVKSPGGGLWYSTTVRYVIKRRCYRGDFAFNANSRGKFFRIDMAGEVVESAEEAQGKLFLKEGAYKSLVPPKTWDKANARLASRAHQTTSRKRVGYPLTGILICDHCGRPMYGCRPHEIVVYRCGTLGKTGRDTCHQYQIREDEILPRLMELLAKEVQDVQALLTAPPENLRSPNKQRVAEQARAEKDRDNLANVIRKAEKNLMYSDDARTRKSLDAQITAMRDELEALEAQSAESVSSSSWSNADLLALNDWWEAFSAQAVSVPVQGKVPLHAHFYQDPASEHGAYLLDPLVVNEALAALGAEVRLRWKTETYTTKTGLERNRHTWLRGRFRLGQSKGMFSNTRRAGDSETYRAVLPLLSKVDVAFSPSPAA
jgi:site-specific DNA recombinase